MQYIRKLSEMDKSSREKIDNINRSKLHHAPAENNSYRTFYQTKAEYIFFLLEHYIYSFI